MDRSQPSLLRRTWKAAAAHAEPGNGDRARTEIDAVRNARWGRSAVIGAALISAAISLDDFIIASFTIGGGNTLSTFVWGKLRTTLDPSTNAIATILLLSTIGMSVLALWLTRYRG